MSALPMSFSNSAEVVSLTDNALSSSCNSWRRKRSRRPPPSFVEAIEHVYDDGFGTLVEKEAGKGAQRTPLTRRR